MAGLNILHVNPRLVGSIRNWSGKDQPDGESWLIKHAQKLGMDTIWIGPLYKTSKSQTVDHLGHPQIGSLYAIRNHMALDREFSVASKNSQNLFTPKKKAAKKDKAHFRHFCKEAEKAGCRVMADLVFNHLASDNPIVKDETKQLKQILKTADQDSVKSLYSPSGTLIGFSYAENNAEKDFHFKFARNENYEALNYGGTTGYDTVQINYQSPEAKKFFITGGDQKQGYFKDVIDWHLDLGFTSFRCDLAYKVPPDWWQELIAHSHDKLPGVIYMAETLGGADKNDRLENARITVNGVNRPAFDLSMASTYWWNMKDQWIVWEKEKLHKISLYGGAGSPDNHDTPNTLAAHFLKALNHMPEDKRMKTVASICLRNYAVSSLLNNSVYMQLGYEYCREQISVFKGAASYKDWLSLQKERGAPDHPLNISRQIRAINQFKDQLNARHATVNIKNIHAKDGLIRISCSLKDQRSKTDLGQLMLFINEKPETGPIRIPEPDVNHYDKTGGQVTNKRMSRLVLGEQDTDEGHFYDVNDIAAFYTPITPAPNTGLINRQSPKAPTAPAA